MRNIYLDNAATTPMYPQVIETLVKASTEFFGNASSTYTLGRMAKKQMEDARKVIANSIHAHPNEIIFTSGGTESNNTALYSLAKTTNKKHIITTLIEHPSVINVFKDLEQQGYSVTYLKVNENGIVDLEDLASSLTEETAFVSIMSVNNEIGSIQNIDQIGKLLKEKNIYFHTDAVQAYGIIHFDMQHQNIDMMSVSAHKIHGPKGIGFLYVRQGTPFYHLLKGGGQEDNRRSGTQNVPHIISFAKAVELINIQSSQQHFQSLQKLLLAEMDKLSIQYKVNGSLCSQEKTEKIINLWLPNISSSKLLIQMDLNRIMISAGSACSAGSLKPSRVILNIFENEKRSQESIRISFSNLTTKEDVISFVEKLATFVL